MISGSLGIKTVVVAVRRFFLIEMAFIRLCFTRETQYRANFILIFVMDAVWYGVNWLFFEVIYLNTDSIAGYSREETLFFLATTFIIDGIDMTFFASSMWMLPEAVRKGDFDLMLTKPISPLMYSTLRNVSLGSFFDTVLAVIIFAFAWWQVGLSPSIIQVICFIYMLGCGIVVMYSLQLMFSSISFLVVGHGSGINMLFHHLYQFAIRPESIYRGGLRIFLISLLPMMVIAALPARVILRGVEIEYLALSTLSAGIFFYAGYRFFYFALSRYESASS